MIRSLDELKTIMEGCPYIDKLGEEQKTGAKKLYTGMLDLDIEKSAEEKLRDIKETGDDFHIAGRNIYIWFDEGLGRSRFAARLASDIGPVTLRNWNTMNKVYDMAQSIK